jgi:hypothetical protein
MSEDLPSPESRVRLDGSRVTLDWRHSNMTAHPTAEGHSIIANETTPELCQSLCCGQ